MRRLLPGLVVLLMTLPFSPTQAARSFAGALVYGGEANGRWDLYGAGEGTPAARLTRELNPVRAPAVSRDGRLAFESRRDGNWEIYSSALDGSGLKRLTNTLAYDGAPSWSPDGKRIAFESSRSGDLDIWVMDADGGNPVDLTPTLPSAEYGPAWSPDGKWIAYTSWQSGNQQLYLLPSGGGPTVSLLATKFDDEQPAWSPDGKKLAFASTREGQKAIYLADVTAEAAPRLENVRRVSFFGYDFAPAFSPDGQWLAFISPRPTRQPIYLLALAGEGKSGPAPRALDSSPAWVSSFAWTSLPLPPPPPLPDEPPLVVEQPVKLPAGEGHPYGVQGMKSIYLAPSWGNLSSRVAGSILALRERIKTESGHDFLSQLSDMMRQLNSPCGVACDFLSWHKSGRAVDTLLSYAEGGSNLLELSREDELGETYWRLWLRAAKQDGTQGEPVKQALWDTTERARSVTAPGQGGTEKRPGPGYYVDVTELAREYGWERISSHDDPDFDWRSNLLAMEYWHFQKTDGLDWYSAMREVYPASEFETNFDWNTLVQQKHQTPAKLFLKGIPPPPSAWKWYVLLPQ